MAEVSYALRTFLLDDAAIAAAFVDRIAVDHIEDEAIYPFAIIKEVTDNLFYSHDGQGNGIWSGQIDVYDDEKIACDTNAALLKVVLSGYQGMMDTVKIGRCFVTNSRGEWSSDGRHFRRILEVKLGTERN